MRPCVRAALSALQHTSFWAHTPGRQSVCSGRGDVNKLKVFASESCHRSEWGRFVVPGYFDSFECWPNRRGLSRLAPHRPAVVVSIALCPG
jgi:hypothetical protein